MNPTTISPRYLMQRTVLLLCVLAITTSAQPIDDELASLLASKPHPQSVTDFSSLPHLSSQNQDTTLICWCFATSSFLESEMQRLGREPVRLSVIYPVYQVFIEKARRFAATKGKSRFSPGDLFGGVLDIVKQYGAIPAASYEGTKRPGMIYSHSRLYRELERYMEKVKQESQWNEEHVVSETRAILDRHLGSPPARFTFAGKEYTPRTFMENVLQIPWDEYLLVTSFSYAPFHQFAELKVPDNWKHDSNFFNVPLNEFYAAFRGALTRGYSVAFDADISEPSYERTKRFAVIPPSDLPEDSIGQAAREARFADGRTTDDHLMHAVSYRAFGGEDWFLVKDSWRTAFEGPNGGYMFFHSSYVKMKALAFLVHRDAVKGKWRK